MVPLLTIAAYEFGEFRLDCSRFALTRKGRPIRLERKPMELLILLVSSNGRLVARIEIAERLWSSEVFVDTEHGINTAIRKIRQVLGDDPEEPRFVHTVMGRGYRFVADVQAIPAKDETGPVAVAAESLPRADATHAAADGSGRNWPTGALVAGALGIVAVLGVGTLLVERLRPRPVEYTRLTDFTDSAVAPALSSDGRMLAFIRGSTDFTSADPIYVKMLPDGEPKLVTNDARSKYALSFSPDGSRIAYSAIGERYFDTYTVSVLGGEPRLLMRNAAGLSWLDKNTLLYSRFLTGIHMEAVVGDASGAISREVYVPPYERAMAHYSYASPDHRWVLIVEMNEHGDWGPCRLVSMDGKTPPKDVGPKGSCTSAAWSPDGDWMYFVAEVDGRSHLWRQRFPDGTSQVITPGPSEESGIAMDPGGRSLISSVGAHETSIWIHDGRGDRALSSEGEVVTDTLAVAFSPDAKFLYYLLRHGPPNTNAELWRTEIDTGNSEEVVPGVAMRSFNLSVDGKEVVYASPGTDGKPWIWISALDRSVLPRRVGDVVGLLPMFGPDGTIYFQVTEGKSNYLEKMRADGSALSKAMPYPISEVSGISPARRWIIADIPVPPFGGGPAPSAVPTDGGEPRRLCDGICTVSWSLGDDYIFLGQEQSSRTTPGRSLAVSLGRDESLGAIPLQGIQPNTRPKDVPGSMVIARDYAFPGKDVGTFAYIKDNVHRNLYRITLP